MKHTQPEPQSTEKPSRRAALRRLACTSVAAYVVPQFIFMSAAQAGGSKPSAPNPVDSFHEAESPEPIVIEPEVPREPEVQREREHMEVEQEDDARESCAAPSANGQQRVSISMSDLTRAQDAIQAGAAQPLENIWGGFTSNYDGRVIGVEFIGQRNHARYRFRAISASGRLETVTISAQTGSIEKIVGCG